MPTRLNSARRRAAFAKPSGEADDRADDAEHQRLDEDGAQHLAARGAERAQQRELARPLGDGDRERVEDQEGADEQRDAGEASRPSEEAELVPDVAGLLGGLLAAGAHLDAARQRLASCALSCSGDTPARPRPGSRRSRSASADHALRLGQDHDGDAAPPKSSAPPTVAMPDERVLLARRAPATATLSPTLSPPRRPWPRRSRPRRAVRGARPST